jgi:hypothetical protein
VGSSSSSSAAAVASFSTTAEKSRDETLLKDLEFETPVTVMAELTFFIRGRLLPIGTNADTDLAHAAAKKDAITCPPNFMAVVLVVTVLKY